MPRPFAGTLSEIASETARGIRHAVNRTERWAESAIAISV
jgi:hypothetical protein